MAEVLEHLSITAGKPVKVVLSVGTVPAPEDVIVRTREYADGIELHHTKSLNGIVNTVMLISRAGGFKQALSV